jgi:hypothetical protein
MDSSFTSSQSIIAPRKSKPQIPSLRYGTTKEKRIDALGKS